MSTHSSVLAWRIPGTGNPGGLFIGSHRVRHDWSDLAAAAAPFKIQLTLSSVQFSSVAHSCLTLWDPMNRSTPGLPVHHQLPESTQTHVHCSRWCHPNISSSVVPFLFCPQSFLASESFPMSQLFTSGAKVLEFQLQHQSFQWTPRTDLL